ncbi:MAG: hypothetical protein GEEBNDBF_02220 [bacterium]|nr:hypothetical protein [bacterium]
MDRRRRVLPMLLGTGLLSLYGCQGGGPVQTPDLPVSETQISLPQVLDSGAGAVEFVAGQYDLQIDPDLLEASLTPVRHGVAQPPQAMSYDLDIDKFLTAQNLRIWTIGSAGEDLLLYLEHQHPFPAVQLDQPASGVNRADLGYTARLFVLTGGNALQFFDTLTYLDPDTVSNADGYARLPAGFIANPGVQFCNVFPYITMVNEMLDNRSVSNGGSPTGSYNPAAGGWQRSNVGDGTNWTGYDFLHGGQAAYPYLRFYRRAIERQQPLRLAVVIKYTDPRGSGGKANRLPSETTNVLEFAYRLPYAALDISHVDAGTEVGIAATVGATSLVEPISVRDWDMAATETSGYRLGDLTNVSLVQEGASGAPVGELHVPKLHNAPVPLTLANPGATGLPGDEAEFSVTLTNDLNPAPGYYYGAVRFTDPEAADPNRPFYSIMVNPADLTPLQFGGLERVTYQVMRVKVGENFDPPVITQVTPRGDVGHSLDQVTFRVFTTPPAFSYQWHFPHGGAETASEITGIPEVTVRLGREGTYIGYVEAQNGGGTSALFPFSFRVSRPGVLDATEVIVDPAINARELSVTQAGVRAHVAVIDWDSNALIYYRATRNIPASPADWVKCVVDPSTAAELPEITLLNDRPVILYRRTIGPVRIAIANSATPASAADFTFYSFGSEVAQHSNIVVRGNRLMFAYKNPMMGDRLEIARATAATPGPGDWLYYRPGFTDLEVKNESKMFFADSPYGNLSLFLRTPAQHLWYLATGEVSPRESGHWFNYPIRLGDEPLELIDYWFDPQTNQPTLTVHNTIYGTVHALTAPVQPYPSNPSGWVQKPLLGNYSVSGVAMSRRIGSRIVMHYDWNSDFTQPAVDLALDDEIISDTDWYSKTLSSDLGLWDAYAVRTLTPASEPRLMSLVAAGPSGFRQYVLERDWY